MIFSHLTFSVIKINLHSFFVLFGITSVYSELIEHEWSSFGGHKISISKGASSATGFYIHVEYKCNINKFFITVEFKCDTVSGYFK